ncbi:MAG: phage terminase large subunit [Erysipelotrichaceae bacterium]
MAKSDVTKQNEQTLIMLALERDIKIEDARNSFYEFCKVINPDFYKPHRTYLKILCETLQNFYEGKLLKPNGMPYKNISISLPPSFGKTFTAKLWSAWCIGQDTKNSIVSASYNEDFAIDFSKTVREIVTQNETDPLKIGYNNIFPEVRLKFGDSAKQQWAIEGSHMTFKATSPKGSSTGSRSNIQVVDDLVKDAYEAMNTKILDEKLDWWRNTFRSRLLQEGLRVNIGTRWSMNDPIGKIMAKSSADWYELSLPACVNIEAQEMLCDDICNWERWNEEKDNVSPEIFWANYQQEPMETVGRLYNNFKEYARIPKDEYGNPLFQKVIAYVDSADKGSDYLCAIVAGQIEKQLFVLDVLYTRESMETTEKKLAEMLHRNNVNECTIESNNGGSIFARNVETILRDTLGNQLITIKTFHQSKNKEARILSTSSAVERIIHFPSSWSSRWTEFFLSLSTFQREFKKNKTDDSADCITGLVELIENSKQPVRAVKSIFAYLNR